MEQTPAQQAAQVYALFRGEPPECRSSYLHDHYRRGKLGVQRPGREQVAALAAWKAGRDDARAAKSSA
jgi:hypothetical protein